jgi:hypothetical protein
VLRRILSLIQAPAPAAGTVADTFPPDEDPTIFASKHYFRSVQSLLVELKDMNNKAYHSGQIIKWYETYAKKIDQLPMHNVDKELLQYGAATSNKLRMLGSSLYGQNIQTNLLNSYKRTEVYAWSGGYGYYGNAWGGYGPGMWAQSNAADVSTAKAENVAKGRTDRQKVWVSIDQDTAEVRRAMVDKYKTEFSVN